MKKQRTATEFLLALAIAMLTSNGLQAAECDSLRKARVGGFIAEKLRGKSGNCQIEIYPAKNETCPQKYTFYDDGRFESDDCYGARSYYFFPRKSPSDFSVSNDRETVSVNTGSGVTLIISGRTREVVGVNGAESWEMKTHSAKNEWGKVVSPRHVSITPARGQLFLDLGWAYSANPERRKGRSSTFLDGYGKSCSLGNLKLFDYHYDNKPPPSVLTDVNSKFRSDADLLPVLRRELGNKDCKALDLSALLGTTH